VTGEEFVHALLMFKDAMDVENDRVYTKVGPVGTGYLRPDPLPPDYVKWFADKYEMTIVAAEKFIADFANLDDTIADMFWTILDAIEGGAKLNGMDLETYAEQVFAGVTPGLPPGRA
jgi:hypothetical protein